MREACSSNAATASASPEQPLARSRSALRTRSTRRRIALRERGVLVGGQTCCAIGDQIVEGLGGLYLDVPGGMGAADLPHALGPFGRAPTPQESLLVHLDGHAIQLDGAFDRRCADGHEAALIGIPEQQQVAADAVAEKRCREVRRVDECRVIAALPWRRWHFATTPQETRDRSCA